MKLTRALLVLWPCVLMAQTAVDDPVAFSALPSQINTRIVTAVVSALATKASATSPTIADGISITDSLGSVPANIALYPAGDTTHPIQLLAPDSNSVWVGIKWPGTVATANQALVASSVNASATCPIKSGSTWTTTACTMIQLGWGSAGRIRNLSGPGTAAKVVGGIAGGAFSMTSPAPVPTAESDGIQAYLAFSAATLANVYDRFELPSDWAGTLKLILTGYNSVNTNAPTVNVYFACYGNAAAITPLTYGSAQPVSVSITSANTKASATVDMTSAVPSCSAGMTLHWKLAITAGASTEFRLLSARFTE